MQSLSNGSIRQETNVFNSKNQKGTKQLMCQSSNQSLSEIKMFINKCCLLVLFLSFNLSATNGPTVNLDLEIESHILVVEKITLKKDFTITYFDGKETIAVANKPFWVEIKSKGEMGAYCKDVSWLTRKSAKYQKAIADLGISDDCKTAGVSRGDTMKVIGYKEEQRTGDYISRWFILKGRKYGKFPAKLIMIRGDGLKLHERTTPEGYKRKKGYKG